MTTRLLSLPLLIILLLPGCATSVLDLPEPTDQRYTQARRLLAEQPLSPVDEVSLAHHDQGAYATAYGPTKYRIRDAVARFCARTHLGRCDAFDQLPYPAMKYDPETINAYADSHDRIVVFSGLVDTIGVEAELGAVIAHEYAHVLLGHSGKKQTNMLTGGLLTAALVGAVAAANNIRLNPWAYQDAGKIGAFLGSRVYSPEMELEADRLSVYILKEAGFPITAMRDALVRLYRTKTGATSSGTALRVGFLETHPGSDRRMAHMLDAITDAVAGLPWNKTYGGQE